MPMCGIIEAYDIDKPLRWDQAREPDAENLVPGQVRPKSSTLYAWVTCYRTPPPPFWWPKPSVSLS